MGLIRAGAGALGGTMADQWKEFFYCDAIDKDTLVVKGAKRTSSRSSNTRGNDNIISSGSGIAVADGQCMIIVEQGKVVEVCAEPGEFTYDTSTEPSIFAGSLGESIKRTFQTIGKRFTYGGDITTTAAAKEYVAENDIWFSLGFGPVLIDNYEMIDHTWYGVGEITEGYARAALCQLINRPVYGQQRKISDIIYFATAMPEGG